MSTESWDELSYQFSRFNDVSRSKLWPWCRQQLSALQARKVLDYGAGDGDFARLCQDLPTIEVIDCYDPTRSMIELAKAATPQGSKLRFFDQRSSLLPDFYDVAFLHAVWMCLSTEKECLTVLSDIRRCLRKGGMLYASVTHPCFRELTFSTTRTDFENKSYLRDGVRFRVHLEDAHEALDIRDTHWSLSAMSRQLRESGFCITELIEFPDVGRKAQKMGAPWLLILASPVN